METCNSLRKNGFISIRMVEVRRRPFDAKFVQLESADVGRNQLENADKDHNNTEFDEESKISGKLVS